MAKKHKVAPTISPVHFTMDEDATLLIKNSELLIHANIDSPANLQVDSITNPQGTLINNNNGTWSFTPSQFFSGPLTLDCVITDGIHRTVQPIQIDVLHVIHSFENHEVELMLQSDGSYLIYTNQLLQNATDIEGDNLDINTMSAPQGDFMNNNDGSWTFIPNSEYLGAIDLQFVVSDGLDSVTQNLLVTVNMPILVPEIDYVINENESFTFSTEDLLQSVADIEGDMLTIADLRPPEGGQLINNDDGTWTYLPPDNYIGPLKLQFGVTDNRGALVDQAINIYTTAENLVTMPRQILPMEEDGSVIISPDNLLAYDLRLETGEIYIHNVASTQGTIKQVGDKDIVYWIFYPNEDFQSTIDLQYTVGNDAKQTSHFLSIEVESNEE